jgi:hypothetical protein
MNPIVMPLEGGVELSPVIEGEREGEHIGRGTRGRAWREAHSG